MGDVVLEVQQLTRKYGARFAVQDLDLSVYQGDIYGFLGPNGAGKTTAIRCILGLIRKDAGTVRIFGQEGLAGRRHVGAIVETPAFHGHLSGADNLRLACAYAGIASNQTEREVARVLERVGLTDRGSDPAGTYSLGMKQRLGLARALLGGPRLLVLDEPGNGLDPRGMHEVRDLVRSLALNDGMTVFLSSHLLAEVQAVCNRVGIIQQGRLRATGLVSELLAHADAEVVEVETDQPDRLEQVVRDLPDLALLGAGEAGRTRIALGEMAPADLNRHLISSGLSVQAFVPVRRSLEDLFLEVTR